MPRAQGLYAAYRTLGLVCDGASSGCTPAVHQQGTATFLTTPVRGGRCLHLYDTDLHLKHVTPPFPVSWPTSPVTRIATAHTLTFAALGPSIAVFSRLRPAALWTGHTAPITAIAVTGDILVSACAERRLLAWQLPTPRTPPPAAGTLLADISLPPNFSVTYITHPPTYLNKVLLASTDGRLLLLNLRTRRIIHTFHLTESRITALTPAPVPDVVAIGTADGTLFLHNLRADETILTFRHAPASDEAGHRTSGASTLPPHAVTAATFRTDGSETLVTADNTGNLFVWDLNRRQLHAEASSVHPGGTALASFLPGEPLLLTAGTADNSVKLHAFDAASGSPRVLRAREGHTLPPTLARFAGRDAATLVSAGLDRQLRLVSVVREARNRSFAQPVAEARGAKARKRRRAEAGAEKGDQRADLVKRLPPVIALAANDMRERDGDFANIVTVHEGVREAYTWRLQDGASHVHVLDPPDGPERFQLAFRRPGKPGGKEKKRKRLQQVKERDQCATCVVLSPCGNFAFVGAQNGKIHSYNLQSGRHQGVYEDASLRSAVKGAEDEAVATWGRAHSGSVVGVSLDACGDLLVSAGAEDKVIKFWNMHGRALEGESIIALHTVTQLTWSRTSDLLAIACDNFCVYIYDASTRKLARKFAGHAAPIADICFDRQGRRVHSASMDGTVRTWDLPSGRNIDTFVCPHAPTSIAVSASGEYLATTHVNDLGISLWVDKSKFSSLLTLGQEPEGNEQEVDLESTIAFEDDSSAQEDGAEIKSDRGSSDSGLRREQTDLQSVVPEPLSAQVATLSTKPLTHWTTLSNLQAIKERNKPVEPAEKPESAPFFLPTVKGLKLQFDVDPSTSDAAKENSTVNSQGLKTRKDSDRTGTDDWTNSEFGRLVAGEQYGGAAVLLRKLDASGVDLEIRTLEGEQARRNAAIFFKEQLGSPQEFELTQAHLSVFLSSQGAMLAKDHGGIELLQNLLLAQEEAWQKVRSAFNSVMTLSAYFSGQV